MRSRPPRRHSRRAPTRAGLARILAIASPDNDASIRLLKKLGFTHQQTMKLTPTATDEVELFANDPPAAPIRPSTSVRARFSLTRSRLLEVFHDASSLSNTLGAASSASSLPARIGAGGGGTGDAAKHSRAHNR
jgi:hypothetical protein